MVRCPTRLASVSTLAIVLIAVAVVLALLIAGGLIVARRRAGAPEYARHVAEADNALEQARAVDRGWDREVLERAARAALTDHKPNLSYGELHLVLVDDRPGIHEDRAHFAAVGEGDEARVVLVRGSDGWGAERVE